MTANRFALAAATGLAWVLVTVGISQWQAGGEVALFDLVAHRINLALLLAPALLLIAQAVVRWPDLGLRAPHPPMRALLAWLPGLYIAGMFAGASRGSAPAASTVAFIAVNCLLVGVSEELMFRGILFSAWCERFGVRSAAWSTSLAFGAVHTLNGFITGDWPAASVQAAAAFMSGVCFAALRVRTGSLLLVIAVHTLWDTADFLFLATHGPDAPTRAGPTWAPLAFVLPMFVYGAFLLRRSALARIDPRSGLKSEC
jgi:membrane protease YdiL (CAAX protease family)